jgi:hypothetical protein
LLASCKVVEQDLVAECKAAAEAGFSADDVVISLSPWVGQEVVVVSLAAGKNQYKIAGVVEHHTATGLNILHSAGYAHQVKVNHVAVQAKVQLCGKRAGLSFNHTAKLKLLAVCPGSCCEEEAMDAEGAWLSSLYINMGWELIQRDADCSAVCYLNVELMQLWVFSWLEHREDELAELVAGAVAKWTAEGCKKLLVPVWSALDCPHYALLVLERDGEKVVKIEYFDSLADPHAGCRSMAEMYRSIIGKAWAAQFGEASEFPGQVPDRSNPLGSCQETGSARCGIHLLYYLELAVRDSLGQFGCLPWPSWGNLKILYNDKLQRVRTMLIKFKDLPAKHKAEVENLEKETAAKAAKEAELVKKVAHHTELLAQLKLFASGQLEKVEYPVYGCTKCSTKGSTCCDPQKKAARWHAQADKAGVTYPSEEASALPDLAEYEKIKYNSYFKDLKEEFMKERKEALAAASKKKFEDWEKAACGSKELMAKKEDAKVHGGGPILVRMVLIG